MVGKLFFPIGFIFLLWLVYFLDAFYLLDFTDWGILPRTLEGIIGIFIAPLLHGSWHHLISNSLPLLFLLSVLYYFYSQIAHTIFLHCYFITNSMVWILARPYIHIGASGLSISLSFFLLFIGMMRPELKYKFISLMVLALNGSIVFSILFFDQSISWESHIYGAISGVVLAYIFRNYDK